MREIKNKTWKKQKVLEWQKSGKSIRSFCLGNKMPPSTLRSWINIFFPKEKKIEIKKAFFKEIKEEAFSKKYFSKIEIDINGITVKIPKHFDEITLKRCLTTIRSL